MDGFLRVAAATNGGALPQSPTNLFLADEVASTCPLITPSPPTNDLINPLPEPPEAPAFIIGEELANKLQSVKDDPSAPPPPPATASDRAPQLTFRNPPDDYCFMAWNWPLIRKLSTWSFGALLVAMAALVASMISALPTTCSPPVQWYQGSVFYEIFPASFHDTDGDGVGDLTGITYYAGYLQELGVGAVRLNCLFPAARFPAHCENASTLLEIAPQLGTLHHFRILADSLHLRNISLLLDLPLPAHAAAADLPDLTSAAIRHWLQHDVDGFYVKGVERVAGEPGFGSALRAWKRLVGPERALIVSEAALRATPKPLQGALLSCVDLIDVRLAVEAGAPAIRAQLEAVQNSTLFAKAAMPWIHWSIGDLHAPRLADRLHAGNATLGAILLQLMLPGTPSIFYGDEIGMRQVDGQDAGQLAAMVWSGKERGILPWIRGRPVNSSLRQAEVVAQMARLRRSSPSIYLNSVRRDGHNKANCEVKYSRGSLLAIQRYYPRRKAFVVVSNLGQAPERADLSELLYSGQIVVGLQPDAKSESISFKDIALSPGQSIVIVLD